MVAALDTRMTTGEAARAAGVSEQTIRVWMRAGRLAHEQTPLGALIDAAALGELIAERERRQQARMPRSPVATTPRR